MQSRTHLSGSLDRGQTSSFISSGWMGQEPPASELEQNLIDVTLPALASLQALANLQAALRTTAPENTFLRWLIIV